MLLCEHQATPANCTNCWPAEERGKFVLCMLSFSFVRATQSFAVSVHSLGTMTVVLVACSKLTSHRHNLYKLFLETRQDAKEMQHALMLFTAHMNVVLTVFYIDTPKSAVP